MARADGKKFGPGVKGKGDGAGAMSELDSATLPANAVLSNRDKSRISGDRGRDGKDRADRAIRGPCGQPAPGRAPGTTDEEDHLMSKRPPPVPPDAGSDKGPGEPPEARDEDPFEPDRSVDPDEKGQSGNLKVNTRHQGYQQDR